MSQKQINQWRSIGFAAFALALLATVLLVVVLNNKASAEVVTMFGSLCTSAWITCAFAFGKSLGEKAADGAGLKGIAKVLMTEAKPGGEPPKES